MWILRKFSQAFFGNDHVNTTPIAGKSIWLLIMHGIALGLGFISNYVLIKFAGAHEFGAYVYAFNLLFLLASICNFGLDNLLLSTVGVYFSRKQYPLLKGLVKFSLIITGSVSVIIAVAFNVIPGFTLIPEMSAVGSLAITAAALFFINITTLGQSSLQSMNQVIPGQFVEKIAKPVLLIVSVILLSAVNPMLTSSDLVRVNLAVIASGALIIIIINLRRFPHAIKNLKASFQTRPWISSEGGFFLVGVLSMVNARLDIFMLGIFSDNTSVGTYSIALRISEMIGFPLTIINLALAPLIVQYSEKGDQGRLQYVITNAARVVLLVALPLFAGIGIFQKDILAIFGNEFVNAAPALQILMGGQLVNIFCGSVGLILLMTGNQKFSIISLALGTFINIALNLILAPVYGAVGTAIASAASMISWNLLMYYFVRKRTAIRPTAFGRL